MDPKYLPHPQPRSIWHQICHDRTVIHMSCVILGIVLSVATTYLGVGGLVVHLVIPASGPAALGVQEALDRLLGL